MKQYFICSADFHDIEGAILSYDLFCFHFFLLFFVTHIPPCLTAAPNRMSTFRFYHDDKTRDVRIPGEEERIADILAFRVLGLIW